MTLERQAVRAWQRWGANWAMFTACHACGEQRVCRGRTRRLLLCLECFDRWPHRGVSSAASGPVSPEGG